MTNEQATLQTRKRFARLEVACIREVFNGVFKPADRDDYIKWRKNNLHETMQGKWDKTFTFLQYKHYLLTGECKALLS